MRFLKETKMNKLAYTNPLKYYANKAKKHQKGLGYFVKLDAGNVPVNNEIFNNSFSNQSTNNQAAGTDGSTVSGNSGSL